MRACVHVRARACWCSVAAVAAAWRAGSLAQDAVGASNFSKAFREWPALTAMLYDALKSKYAEGEGVTLYRAPYEADHLIAQLLGNGTVSCIVGCDSDFAMQAALYSLCAGTGTEEGKWKGGGLWRYQNDPRVCCVLSGPCCCLVQASAARSCSTSEKRRTRSPRLLQTIRHRRRGALSLPARRRSTAAA